MQKTTMTVKGQVTVPKPLRDALGLKPGSSVEFEYAGPGRATMRASGKKATNRFRRVRGSLKERLSTDEILALLRGD
jgi:antitoxin PrlF